MRSKKIIIYILFMFIPFLCVPSIKAETNAYVTADALRIRKEATTDSTTLIKIYSGEIINIIDFNKKSGTGCSSGWYKVKYNNIEGYVCSEYIKVGTINSEYNISNYTARVNATSLSVRSYASSSASLLASLLMGTNITILDTLSSGNGCAASWYKINYHDGKIGYVCSTYIVKKEDITATDAEYEKVLSESGFPTSYHPYLIYLHKKFPNWQFKAIKTNLKWNNVISGESGKNYIQTTYDAYRTSSKPKEGSTWFEANDGVNAFFLDPRNFLTEKYIFMFENLQYDESTQEFDVVKSIFGSSYLSAEEYVNYFINAGKQFNVSPVHLASRVVQEGGSKSTYEPITGTSSSTYSGKSLKGFYNYYNIGAHADSITSNPVVRGLAYAGSIIGGTSYGRPWTTRQKAILGGADFISSGYISKGQYTLYFEKFNTSPTASNSAYTHQYMTNIQAPMSEGSNIYYSYKDNNLIQNAYSFAIPVYDNMPDVVSLPTIGDIVNTLSSISINNNNLNEFDPDVVSYTYYVGNDTTNINIKATPTSSLSKVEVSDTILDEEKTTITIKVTSQAGIIKVYTVMIIKVSDANNINELLSSANIKTNNDNILDLKENTIINTLILSIKKYSPSSNITFNNSTGFMLNPIDIISTGQKVTININSNETRTYNLIVKGDTSGDGKITILDLLQVQKDILKSKSLNGSYSLAADTSGDGKISILDLLQIQKHILGDKKL